MKDFASVFPCSTHCLLSQKETYDYHVQGLLEAARNVVEQSVKQATEDVVLLQREAGNEKPGDVAVTANRTWMKRGITSLHGVTTVIAWPTGQIVDFGGHVKVLLPMRPETFQSGRQGDNPS